jgi:hypothetical protein
MPDRIHKRSVAPASTARKLRLLEAILRNPIDMPSCSACRRRGISSCRVSPDHSQRCAECVRLGAPNCDVSDPSVSQLRKIASQHQKLEDELLEAEEKVLRLRRQKKLWFEKMIRAVSKGLDTVEELERVEKEEAEAEASRSPQPSAGRSSTEGIIPPDFDRDWSECFGDLPLEPALMEDFSCVAWPHGTSSGVGESSSGV